MKIVKREYFVELGEFVHSQDFVTIVEEVNAAISLVTWNSDAEFIINPTLKGNGVNPIKKNFVAQFW